MDPTLLTFGIVNIALQPSMIGLNAILVMNSTMYGLQRLLKTFPCQRSSFLTLWDPTLLTFGMCKVLLTFASYAGSECWIHPAIQGPTHFSHILAKFWWSHILKIFLVVQLGLRSWFHYFNHATSPQKS